MADPRFDDDLDPPEPPRIRALRRLVTLLTMSAILGVVVVSAALVIRLSKPLTAAPDLSAVTAAAVALPQGETALAASLSGGALTVLTRDGDGAQRLRLFDPETGAEAAVVAVERR